MSNLCLLPCSSMNVILSAFPPYQGMLGGDDGDGSKEKNGEANFDHRSGTEVIFCAT